MGEGATACGFGGEKPRFMGARVKRLPACLTSRTRSGLPSITIIIGAISCSLYARISILIRRMHLTPTGRVTLNVSLLQSLRKRSVGLATCPTAAHTRALFPYASLMHQVAQYSRKCSCERSPNITERETFTEQWCPSSLSVICYNRKPTLRPKKCLSVCVSVNAAPSRDN